MSFKTLGLGAAILANISLASSPEIKPFPLPVNPVNDTDFVVVADPTDVEEKNNVIPRIDIDSANRSFVDAFGRQVIFHGVNVVYKVDPYIPSDGEFDSQNSLNDEDIANLVKWGQNFVRLGVMWEAVERTEGVYDEAYLDSVEVLINKLGEAGIYTLVDAHQDVFARTICGEGIPDFYAKELLKRDDSCFNPVIDRLLKPVYNKLGICLDFDDYGFRVDENGDPLIEDCQTVDFYQFYETKQSIAAFGAFFNNKLGVQDKFVQYWDHVSARFAQNPYVVGYDPLNEPFPANPARDPMLFVPGHADKNYLAPMYEKVFAKYQSHDTYQQMWFEPVPFPDEAGVLEGYVFPVGFENPPGGEIGSSVHVLNDHTYCCQLSFSECLTGEPQVEHADQCLAWHEKRIGTRAEDAKRLGVPLVITEFGACLTEGPCSQEINQVGDVADEHLVGWAYWQFKTYEDLTTSAGTGSEGFYNQDGTLQAYKVRALARSYMPYTQGNLTSMSFDTESGRFVAEFIYSSEARLGSVAYLSRDYWYGAGPAVGIILNDLTPVDKYTVGYTYENNYYSFDMSLWPGIQDGDKVTFSASVYC